MLRRSLHRLWPLAVLAGGCAKGVDPPAATPVIPIEGETFTMGSTDLDPCDRSDVPANGTKIGCQLSREQSEALHHEVKVDDFCIDQHEVTIDQYRYCVAHGACSDPKVTNAGDREDERSITRYYRNHERYGSFPVLGVTIDQAREYCRFRGGRLPTEVEWEFAARSRGTRDALVWEGANVVGNCAQQEGAVAYGDCVDGRPRAVMSSPLDRTAQDVHDMAGNAQEWVEDEFSFFAYCAADQGGGQRPEDLYRIIDASTFKRAPRPDAPVSDLLLADGADQTCVDVPQGQPGHNARDGGCADRYEDCLVVCRAAWSSNPPISRGQDNWREEECRRAHDTRTTPDDCRDCAATGDAARCEAFCDCFDTVEAPESDVECVQACIAGAVACLGDAACTEPDVRAACVNTAESGSLPSYVPQPICHVRRDKNGGPYPADEPHENEGGPLDGFHVVRGGHFQETAACGVRPTRREAQKGNAPSPVIGFRCAYDPGQSPACP